MSFEWYIYVLIFLVGIVCGILNTVAGGGSLITLPILMAIGLPDNQANVTNRLGFLTQSAVASFAFKKKKTFEWEWGLKPVIPLVLGTFLGSIIAVHVEVGVTKIAIGVLLVFMLPFIFFQPEKWLKKKVQEMPKTRWWLYIVYFFLGIYAGFLQAGIGYFLLFVFVLGAGYDLLTANSLKVFVVLFTTIASIAVFLYHSHIVAIRFDIGIAQALGQAVGAYFGVHFAVKLNPKVIRYFLIIIILIFSMRLLFFDEMI